MSNKLSDFNHIDLLYPGKYLKGADLRGRTVTVTIEKIDPRHELRRVDDSKDYKPVVFFVGKERGWVMNKTNAQIIAKLHGAEITSWIGKKIALHTEKVKAFGKTHDAIRVVKQAPK